MNEQESSSFRISEIAALAFLNFGITISWIAYHEFQPSLVEQFGFGEEKLLFAIVQAVIFLIVPPAAGFLTDQLVLRTGSRLPVVQAGISAVSMIFLVVALTIFTEPEGTLKILFPVLIVLWLVTMNIFHAPALSTLEEMVPAEKLAPAMALLIIGGEIAEALEPLLGVIFEFIGAPVTFLLGGIIVFTAGYWFGRIYNKQKVHEVSPELKEKDYGFPAVFGLGFILGLGSMLIFEILPGEVGEELAGLVDNRLSGKGLSAIVAGIVVVAAWPAGQQVQRTGTLGAVILGFVLCLLTASGFIFFRNVSAVISVLFFSLPFALLSVSALPEAFRQLGPKSRVFGIGLFFAGAELPSALWKIYQLM